MLVVFRKIRKFNTSKYVALPIRCSFEPGEWVKVEEIDKGVIQIRKAEAPK